MATDKNSPYGGMTVNERLYEAGIFAEFERAAYAQDTSKIETLLAKVDLSPESIRSVIDSICNSPQSIYRKKSSTDESI